MSAIEAVHALMTEIGPAMDLAGVAEMTPTGPWTLVDREKTVIFIDHVPDTDRLWLSAEIGVAAPTDRARLVDLILMYNAQWLQTGGARIGLDGPDGRFILAVDIATSGVDLPYLSGLLANFRTVLEGWRTILSGAQPPNEIPPVMFGSGFIRG